MSKHSNNPWTEPDQEVVRFGQILNRTDGRLVHDIGCGAGRHALALAEAGLRVIASDVTPDIIRRVSTAFRTGKRTGHGLISSMLAYPLKTSSLDGVVAFNVLYHATHADMKGAVSEIFRTLKPDGVVYLTLATPAHGSYGRGQEIEPHTFAPPSGVLHHFTDRDDATALLHTFNIVEWRQSEVDYLTRDDETIRCVHWRIIARKG